MKYAKIILILSMMMIAAGCRGNANQDAGITNAPVDPDFVQGVFGNPTKINGVWQQVNDIRVISAEGDGHAGFAYIILSISIVNESADPVLPASITLVDRFENVYVTRQDNSIPFADQLQPMPLTVGTNESVTGTEVYLVPLSALQSDLRMRWESTSHNSRIDILLGALELSG
ncbi:MAG: hypothetical protein AAF490_29920 [Chloroflexota bacterium]